MLNLGYFFSDRPVFRNPCYRRAFLCFLALFLSLPSAFADWPEGVSRVFIRGDLNKDRAVTLADYQLLEMALLDEKAYSDCRDILDVDNSGMVNADDALFLRNYLFGGGPAPDHPFSRPGYDLQRDEISCGDVPTAFIGVAQEYLEFIEGAALFGQIQFDNNLDYNFLAENDEAFREHIWPPNAAPGENPEPGAIEVLNVQEPGIYQLGAGADLNGNQEPDNEENICCLLSSSSSSSSTSSSSSETSTSASGGGTSATEEDSEALLYLENLFAKDNNELAEADGTESEKEEQCGGRRDVVITFFFPGVDATSFEEISKAEAEFIVRTGRNSDAEELRVPCCDQFFYWVTYDAWSTATSNAKKISKTVKDKLDKVLGGKGCTDPETITITFIGFSAGGLIAVDTLNRLDTLVGGGSSGCECKDGERQCPGNTCAGNTKVKIKYKLITIASPWEGTPATPSPFLPGPFVLGWSIGSSSYDPGEKPPCGLCEMKFYVPGSGDDSIGGKDPLGDSQFSDAWKDEIRNNISNLSDQTTHTGAIAAAFPWGHTPKCNCGKPIGAN